MRSQKAHTANAALHASAKRLIVPCLLLFLRSKNKRSTRLSLMPLLKKNTFEKKKSSKG